MSLDGELDQTGRILKGAAALAALALPSGLLIAVIDLPRDVERLAGAIMTVVSIAVVLAIATWRDHLRLLSTRAATLVLGAAVICGIATALIYWRIASVQVLDETYVASDGTETATYYVVPFQPTDELSNLFRLHSPRDRALVGANASRVKDLIKTQNGWTVAALVGLLVLAHLLLVGGIVAAAWRLTDAPSTNVPPIDAG